MKRFLLGLLLITSVFVSVVPQVTMGATLGNYQGRTDLGASQDCNSDGAQILNFLRPTCVLLDIMNWLLKLSAFFLYNMALLFETAIDYSLNIRDLLESLPIVNIGWAMFRDLANLTFIFILLYAAINIILGTNGYNVKSILTKIILVAVFINFSLFFTKIVVDLSNIAALQFYAKLAEGSKPGPDGSTGITGGLMTSLGLTKFYKSSNTEIRFDSDGKAAKPKDALYNDQYWASNVWNVILVAIMATTFFILTGFVLGAAAIMFVIRSAVLMFLMLLSPLAFAAVVIPGMSNQFETWKKSLFNQAFFAPIYMALFYTVVVGMRGWGSAQKGKGLDFDNFVFATGGWIEVLFSFTIIIILMFGCLYIAEMYGAKGSKFASKWGKSIAMAPLNWATAGAKRAGNYTKGMAGNIGSGFANFVSNTGAVQKLASNRVLGALGGRAFLRKTNDLGKTYRESVEKKQKLIESTGKIISQKDPGLKQNDGESYGDFEKRKKDAQKAAGNLAMGLTADGQSSRGLSVLTPTGFTARKAIIKKQVEDARKKAAEKTKASETGPKAVIEQQLKKMLYGNKDAPEKVSDYKYETGTHDESSTLGKLEKEIKDKERMAASTNITEREYLILKDDILAMKQKRDSLVSKFEDLQAKHKTEEEKAEKLADKFDDLGKALKSK